MASCVEDDEFSTMKLKDCPAGQHWADTNLSVHGLHASFSEGFFHHGLVHGGGTVGAGVGAWVGKGVGDRVGDGVNEGVGEGVGEGVSKLVGDGVGDGVGKGVGAGVGGMKQSPSVLEPGGLAYDSDGHCILHSVARSVHVPGQ